jgi:hypothetical protein
LSAALPLGESQEVGIDQILLPAPTERDAAPLCRGAIRGLVLKSETDAPPAPLSAGSGRGGVAGDFDFMADTGPYLLLERTVSAYGKEELPGYPDRINRTEASPGLLCEVMHMHAAPASIRLIGEF